MTKTELMVETLKLEGHRWRLYQKIDKCFSIYEWPKLQRELGELNNTINSNVQTIKEMKSIKRRMMR